MRPESLKDVGDSQLQDPELFNLILENVSQLARQSRALAEILIAKGVVTKDELDELMRSTEELSQYRERLIQPVRAKESSRRWPRLLASGITLALLIVLVVAVRLPFLSQPMLSEEGEF